MKNFGFLILLTLFTVQVDARASSQPEKTAVEFVTDFYKTYLDGYPKTHLNNVGMAFSKSLLLLRKNNRENCRLKSRGDDICGVDDGDIFLAAQDIEDHISFTNSHFVAQASLDGPNNVVVSFNIYPSLNDRANHRKVRYTLIREENEWRVDDILYIYDDGSYSMRQAIAREDRETNENAKNLDDTWFWVQDYTEKVSLMDKLCRFIHFPIEICNESGNCSVSKKRNKKLDSAIGKIRALYGRLERSHTLKKDGDDFGKKESLHPMEGSKVEKGAFTFLFKNSLWWVSRIDLRNLKDTF